MKVCIALMFFLLLGVGISNTLPVSSSQSTNEDKKLDNATDVRLTDNTEVAASVNLASIQSAPDNSELSHPLLPSLKLANECYQRILDDVVDYTCILVKRERIKGRLREREYMFAKVRHEKSVDENVVTPFCVYLNYKGPGKVKGREVLYIRGHHDDKLLFRKGGTRLPFITGYVNPTGIMAMGENRYPITEFGIQRLVERMIEMGQQELEHGECEVEICRDAELSGCNAVCTCVEIKHSIRRPHFEYHLVRVYIDNELGVPVRFESYDWPVDGSDTPVLKEEYTYRDLKLNVGLKDEDFKNCNPEYGFRIPERVVTLPANDP